jgi:hypothetical protein
MDPGNVYNKDGIQQHASNRHLKQQNRTSTSSSSSRSSSTSSTSSVLIPPSFGTSLEVTTPPSNATTTSTTNPLLSSSMSTIPPPHPTSTSADTMIVVEPCTIPHYWVYHYTVSPINQFLQRQSHLSHRILGREHMQSGLSIRTTANTSSVRGKHDNNDIAIVATVLADGGDTFPSSTTSPSASSSTLLVGSTPFLFPNSGCISLAKLWHSSTNRSHFGFAVRTVTSNTNANYTSNAATQYLPSMRSSATTTTNSSSFLGTTGATFLSYDPLGLSIFATAVLPDTTTTTATTSNNTNNIISSCPTVQVGMMYSNDSYHTVTSQHTLIEQTKFGIGSSLGFSPTMDSGRYSTTTSSSSTTTSIQEMIHPKYTQQVHSLTSSSLLVPKDITLWLALRRPLWSLGLQLIAPFLPVHNPTANNGRVLIPLLYDSILDRYNHMAILDKKYVPYKRLGHHSFFFTCNLTSGGERGVSSSSSVNGNNDGANANASGVLTIPNSQHDGQLLYHPVVQPYTHVQHFNATTTYLESPVVFSFYATKDITPSSTLQQRQNDVSSSTTLSACLSQIIRFDRKVYNLLEDRCPIIRNTAVWALEVKHTITPICSKESSTDTSTTTIPITKANGTSTESIRYLSSSILSAAVAYQINRNIAIKLHLDNMGFSAALLCKKWSYPSIIVSFIGGMDKWQLRPFWGVGIEVESDHLSNNNIRSESSSTVVAPRKITDHESFPIKKEHIRKNPLPFVS